MLFSMSSSYTEGITKDLSNQSKLKKTPKGTFVSIFTATPSSLW